MNRAIILLLLVLLLVPQLSLANLGQEEASALSAVIQHLETDYVEAETGRAAAEHLRSAETRERLAQASEGEPFADALSTLLQDLTGDGHLNLEYSAEPARNDHSEESFSDDQMERWYGAHINYGVERIERLEGNVGLLDLRVFSPLDMGGDAIVGAMNVLADTDALIIDLRRNGGGIGDTADLVASYLFDGGRQPLTGTYDRPSDTLVQRFTQAYVPGKRFGGDKPVYVLISKKTFSAAEALAYNLQALERATIVGETSGGGAHPFEYLPVTDHYVLWSVTAKSVNPLTRTNWQSVGVQPDIPVKAEHALTTAMDHLKGQ